MLIDSFLPVGITQIAVDSIFMMPQLGVLSSIHEKAAIEVFNKDCLVRLGTCIAPLGIAEKDNQIMEYSIKIGEKLVEGTLKFGEIVLIKAKHMPCKTKIGLKGDFTIDEKKDFLGDLYGGEVGIILDGRGRPFNFNYNTKNREELIGNWQKSINEYPERDF